VTVGLREACRLGAIERPDLGIDRPHVMQSDPIHPVSDIGDAQLCDRIQHLLTLLLVHSSLLVARRPNADTVRFIKRYYRGNTT
jgi:hypothetical protein